MSRAASALPLPVHALYIVSPPMLSSHHKRCSHIFFYFFLFSLALLPLAHGAVEVAQKEKMYIIVFSLITLRLYFSVWYSLRILSQKYKINDEEEKKQQQKQRELCAWHEIAWVCCLCVCVVWPLFTKWARSRPTSSWNIPSTRPAKKRICRHRRQCYRATVAQAYLVDKTMTGWILLLIFIFIPHRIFVHTTTPTPLPSNVRFYARPEAYRDTRK